MATVAAPVTPLRDRPASSRRSAATAASSSTHPVTPFSLGLDAENDSPVTMFATPTLATPPPWSPATSTKTPTAPPVRRTLFGANSSSTPVHDDDDDHISIHDVESPTLMLAGPGAPWRTAAAATARDQRARSRRTVAAPSARTRRGQSTPPPADRSSTASSKASTPTQARPPRFRLPVHQAPVRPASFHATASSILPDAAAVARLPAARKTRAGGMHHLPPLKRAQTQPVPAAAPAFSTPIVTVPDPVIRPRNRSADPAVALPLPTAPPLSTRETNFVDNLIRAQGRPRSRKLSAEVVGDVAVHFADNLVVTPPRVRTAPPVLPRRAGHDAPPVTEAAIRGAQDAVRLATTTTARVGSVDDLVANAVGIDVDAAAVVGRE
ncbi:hypothetical protein AMAG_07377 [Allomyces macrogynus ATCC 38327]|uniref:Uncharacterized protein n=1 Tax=Allomyces macrogynus (strain ATCC 38327) TaxID=578462 RepID=A0A0L0SI47_ALLM3|nr:hypothetical protein AMAG_07377 [Allomyces macrogynus ATCC 38327]|eukprot:KNE62132.1 hypothetical protein AMAG_07377 [Allomyces macrogynus ATCC 38327]